MKNSAVILVGGFSRRLGQDKGLVELAGKPLVLHVVERIFGIVDETVVVASSSVQGKRFDALFGHGVKLVVDRHEPQSPLVGVLTGLETARGEHSLLLPCDTPFVSTQIAQFLLDKCIGRDAAIPKWPSGYLEPLHAAYNTKLTLIATKKTMEEGKLDLRSMISHLGRVRYVSTASLGQMDPKLLTFFNINTLEDLRKAESLLK
ncbi:MAG: molybdenum cofactor guanylyltransferase [Candidatus Bathyarchaeota archaeon]|nr:MAG: molybdenum cofactor guanylyltransferase [Candidatus Bathyarchaeota archaeon]